MRKIFLFFASCYLLFLFVFSCRIPEKLAEPMADRLLKIWQSVDTNDALIMHYPVTGKPAITVRFRNQDLQKASYGFVNRILGPPELRDFASGGRWGSVWFYNAQAKQLLAVEGLRDWEPEANRKVLVQAIKATFRQFDLSRSSGVHNGRDTDIVTARPFEDNPYLRATVSENDKQTGFVHKFSVLDEKDRVISYWETKEYKTNVVFADDEFDPPKNELKTKLHWKIGEGQSYQGDWAKLLFKPLLAASLKGAHYLQQGSADVWGLVSDYSGETQSIYVIQWPAGVLDFKQTFARQMKPDGNKYFLGLNGPYIWVQFSDDRRHFLALGEVNAKDLLELLDGLVETKTTKQQEMNQ